MTPPELRPVEGESAEKTESKTWNILNIMFITFVFKTHLYHVTNGILLTTLSVMLKKHFNQTVRT